MKGPLKKKCLRHKMIMRFSYTAHPPPYESIVLKHLALHRYQLHIAGHSCAASLKYRLACGSLVFLVKSPFEEFWYGVLRHRVNVVFVEADGSDFLEQLAWVLSRPVEAEAIAGAGAEVARTTLAEEKIDCYWALATRRYLHLASGWTRSAAALSILRVNRRRRFSLNCRHRLW